WRLMFGSESIPAFLYFIFLFFIPESPRWLLMKGRDEKALKILSKLNSKEEVLRLFGEIKSTLTEKNNNSWKLLMHPSFRLALMVGIGLSVFQQITGINAILYYAPEIFKAFGSDAN